jgi:hypothetical protein
VVISTTNIVVDSIGHQGFPLIFTDQSPSVLKNITEDNLNVSQIQFLLCSKALVSQSGTLDTQSNTLYNGTLHPNIHKNYSKWMAAADMNLSPQNSTLLGGDLVRKISFHAYYYSCHQSGQIFLLTTLQKSPTAGELWTSKEMRYA